MVHAVRELSEALETRYVLEREVGHGAMATVFLARELQHNRQVAIKVLDPESMYPAAAERFLREIQTAATLTHPNILPVHDSGRAAGLLYYVTPYVSGQTLRDCLKQEGRLPVADALAITRQIADALSYAHEQGVVHRDVKPENILLTSARQIWVADFGLAHALSSNADTRLTASGISIGSPLYMSPEQAGGSSRVDARADIYALGCLLYEMLCGAPPFSGDDVASVLAKHLTLPAPRAIQKNRDVPPHVDAAIARALEKSPAKRFQSAREFRDALSPQSSGWLNNRRRTFAVGAALLTIAIALILLWRTPPNSLPGVLFTGFRDPGLDTARYVVLPFDNAGQSDVESQQRMHDALRRWRGIEVVDLIRVHDAIGREDQRVTTAAARRIARSMDAGRFVRGTISRIDGRYRVFAGLYDAAERNRLVDQATVIQASAAIPLDSLFSWLADSLLFDPGSPNARTPIPRGTTSRPARESYRLGHLALLEWEIPRADSMFSSAVTHDPEYAQAHLWLAEVRSWITESPAQWTLLAERALAGKNRLSEREQRLAEAMHALATSQFPRACAIYDSLVTADAQDFVAVYGSADCRRRDRMIVADASSETGHRFRSNFYRAILQYQRAFQLLPETYKAFQPNSFARIRNLLFTHSATIVTGRNDKDQLFAASAVVRGDSIVFLPYPAEQFFASGARTSPEAVAKLRAVFADIARTWSTRFPQSASALQANGLASDLAGDSRAIESIRSARRFATDANQRAHLAALEVVLAIKRALPNDVTALAAARILADSLITQNAASENWSPLASSIALIAGHPDYAAKAARADALASVRSSELSADLLSDAHALLTYASIGVRTDSITILERRLRPRLLRARGVDPAVVHATLVRPAGMAFPHVRLPNLPESVAANDYLLAAESMFARGDPSGSAQSLFRLKSIRASANPADLQFDALYPEAWLIHAAGRVREAADWLDPTLNALSEVDPAVFEDHARTAGLLRAVELRAHIAQQLGDRPGARLWANALLVLWQDADPVLQPVVAGLRRLH